MPLCTPLSPGLIGKSVLSLQQFLQRIGPQLDLPAVVLTEKYDANTTRAVIALQERIGVRPATGTFDSLTIARMRNALGIDVIEDPEAKEGFPRPREMYPG